MARKAAPFLSREPSGGRDRVLPFLCDELTCLARRAEALEHALAEFLSPGSSPAPATLVALQDLDLMRQTLEDLARLAGSALAAAAPEAGELPPFAPALKLADLRQRFLDGETTQSRAGPKQQMPDPLFFEDWSLGQE